MEIKPYKRSFKIESIRNGDVMGIWAWVQPVDRIWKVMSDYEKGRICVYNETNNLVFEQTGLSKEALELIEKNFLAIVATNITGVKSGVTPDTDNKKSKYQYDYMYA